MVQATHKGAAGLTQGRWRLLVAEWWLRGSMVLVFFVPYLWWQFFTPVQALDVLVVDKTVPDHQYREHLGLAWVLRHAKVTGPDNRLYDPARDYYGFRPEASAGDGPLEVKREPDLIYMADTYGVFSADLGQNQGGARSQLVYGGLTMDEWNQLWSAKGAHTTFIMEFNSIASPTGQRVRRQVEADMQLAWTGWIGRYFSDLASVEVPAWMQENYARRYGEPWTFRGPGLAFVDEADKVVVLSGNEVEGMVTFQLTPAGQQHYPGVGDAPYPYWFDVIVPARELTVEATYQVAVSEAGRGKLQGAGIPPVFPAVVRHPDGRTYYFAGDYADRPGDPPFRLKGMRPFMKFFVARKEDMFYWRAYVPIMSTILSEVGENR